MKADVFAHQNLSTTQRCVLFVVFIFMLFEVFGGALRYSLAQEGVPWLIYTPKLLIILLVMFALVAEIYRKGIGIVIASLLLLLMFSLVGIYFTGKIAQVAFGLFVILPLLLGIIAEPAVTRFGSRLIPYIFILWLCAATGVIYDYFVHAPWAGNVYEIGGYQISSSRLWWAFGGVYRNAGFSRASYSVADQLLFLALPIMFLRRGLFFNTIIWVTTGLLILLTTTKKTVGVYALLTILFPLLNLHITPRIIKRTITKFLPWIVMIIGIALPLSVLLVDYSFSIQSIQLRYLFLSFEDRLTQMWPDAFYLIFHDGNPIIGRGIGGIGAPQAYFDSNFHNSADNLFVYLYAICGVLSFFIIGQFTLYISKLKPIKTNWEMLIWFWGIALLMNGWANNVIEGSLTSVLLGITYAYMLRNRNIIISSSKSVPVAII